MNKSLKRIIAIFSTSLISASTLLSTFSSADYELYSSSNRSVDILPKHSSVYDFDNKRTDSSIWIGYSSAPVYISVYGTNSEKSYDMHDINSASSNLPSHFSFLIIEN